MSRSKKIYVLLGVLLVVCVATLGVSRYEAYKEEIKNSDEVILKLARKALRSTGMIHGCMMTTKHFR